MKEFEDLRTLLRDKKALDMDALGGAFEKLSEYDNNYKLNFIIFSSSRSPVDLFNEWHSKAFLFDIDEFNGFYILNLSKNIKRGDRSIKGSFGICRFNETDIWVAFTSESSDFFKNGVIRFIESYKPDISRIYLSSEELRLLFENVEENLSSKIYVKKAVLYSHIKEGQINFKKGMCLAPS
jgi:hypothetical protein